MEPLTYIAKIAAVLYLCIGLGSLINKNLLKSVVDDYVKSPGALYIGSIMAMLMGFGILYVHNTWSMDWTSLITLMGWGAILKGVFSLIFPHYMVDLAGKFSKMKNLYLIVGISTIALGLDFGYFGFIA